MTTTRSLFATGVLMCHLFAGCDVVVPGSARPVDPKLDREAEQNSPECKFPAWMLEKKEPYTKEEFDQRSTAAKACIDAKIRYIRNKEKGRGA